MTASLARPFLKWVGGKGRLIPQYESLFPPRFSRYYEPFLGGGAVFFHLSPPDAYLSDINPELVNVYQCVRDCVEDLIQILKRHQRRHCHPYYYQIRRLNPRRPVERAGRLIYLNKTCFNGLYRENLRGEFNVPMGRYKKPAICDETVLRAASQQLQGAHIEQRSFGAIANLSLSSSDFVYFDPPYFPISATSRFTGYSRYAFGEAEQRELKTLFTQLADRGVAVMLSNSDCPFIRDLYQEFQIHDITAARYINSKTDKRGKIAEVVITSYAAP